MEESLHPGRGHHPTAGRRRPHRPADAGEAFALDRRLSPEEINRLEMAAWTGPIHLVQTREQVHAGVAALERESLLGFDTETRPSFKKGESHSPALMQLAGRDAVYVFQLHAIGLPPELAALLASPRIVKAGVAIARDLDELRRLTEFQPQGFVDVGICAAKCGMKHHGLRGMAALLLGCRISKGAQLTNWERPELPRPALRYAATDAWIGRRIYEELKERGCLDRRPARTAEAPAPRARKEGLWRKTSAAVSRLLRGARRTVSRGVAKLPLHRDGGAQGSPHIRRT